MNASVGILVIPWTATMHQLHDIPLKQANAVVAIIFEIKVQIHKTL